MGEFAQTILDYSVYDGKRAGFETVIFIITHQLEQDFRRLVGDRIGEKMDVQYAYQDLGDLPRGYASPSGRTKPWGTTHALLSARDLVKGPFAVINADDYYGPGAYRAIYDFLKDRSDKTRQYAMVGYRLGGTVTDHGSVSRGVCQVGDDGLLKSIVERKQIEKAGDHARFTTDGGKTWEQLSADTLVSMNFWGFQRSIMDLAWSRFPAILDGIMAQDPQRGEHCLPTLVGDLIDAGEATVKVLPSQDRWYGVTYREDRAQVAQALARMTEDGLYPPRLWSPSDGREKGMSV
jgi:NDP-sugar pyrophosphorylase family protein